MRESGEIKGRKGEVGLGDKVGLGEESGVEIKTD